MKVKFSSDDGIAHTKVVFSGKEDVIHARTNNSIVINESKIISHTEEYWNNIPQLVSEKNTIYVYIDHQSREIDTETTEYIPSIKIGDGSTYLIDLPFTDALFTDHIENTDIHVTLENKIFWNNKVSAVVSEADENLIFRVD